MVHIGHIEYTTLVLANYGHFEVNCTIHLKGVIFQQKFARELYRACRDHRKNLGQYGALWSELCDSLKQSHFLAKFCKWDADGL